MHNIIFLLNSRNAFSKENYIQSGTGETHLQKNYLKKKSKLMISCVKHSHRIIPSEGSSSLIPLIYTRDNQGLSLQRSFNDRTEHMSPLDFRSYAFSFKSSWRTSQGWYSCNPLWWQHWTPGVTIHVTLQFCVLTLL